MNQTRSTQAIATCDRIAEELRAVVGSPALWRVFGRHAGALGLPHPACASWPLQKARTPRPAFTLWSRPPQLWARCRDLLINVVELRPPVDPRIETIHGRAAGERPTPLLGLTQQTNAGKTGGAAWRAALLAPGNPRPRKRVAIGLAMRATDEAQLRAALMRVELDMTVLCGASYAHLKAHLA